MFGHHIEYNHHYSRHNIKTPAELMVAFKSRHVCRSNYNANNNKEKQQLHWKESITIRSHFDLNNIATQSCHKSGSSNPIRPARVALKLDSWNFVSICFLKFASYSINLILVPMQTVACEWEGHHTTIRSTAQSNNVWTTKNWLERIT